MEWAPAYPARARQNPWIDCNNWAGREKKKNLINDVLKVLDWKRNDSKGNQLLRA